MEKDSGQLQKSAKFAKNKKWTSCNKKKPIKFEKELSFLIPFLEQPAGLQKTNLSISIPEEENENTENSSDDEEIENVGVLLSDSHETPASSATPSPAPSTAPSPAPSMSSGGRLKRKPQKRSALSPLEEYLAFKKEHIEKQSSQSDAIDAFFSSLAQTVKGFPKQLQVRVKQKLFKIVNDAEESLIAPPLEVPGVLPVSNCSTPRRDLYQLQNYNNIYYEL